MGQILYFRYTYQSDRAHTQTQSQRFKLHFTQTSVAQSTVTAVSIQAITG